MASRQLSSSKVEGASKFEPISPEPSSPLRPGVSASPSARCAKPRSSSKVGLPSDDGSDSPRGSSDESALGGASGARRNSRSSSKCGEGEMLRSVSLDAVSPGAAAPGSTSASAAARSPSPTTRPALLREFTEALARGESMSPLGGSPRGGVGRSPKSMHMMPSIDDVRTSSSYLLRSPCCSLISESLALLHSLSSVDTILRCSLSRSFVRSSWSGCSPSSSSSSRWMRR